MRVFGIDPGSERTGYGCVETDGRRHRLVICGAIATAGAADFATRLATIHAGAGRATSASAGRPPWPSRACSTPPTSAAR